MICRLRNSNLYLQNVKLKQPRKRSLKPLLPLQYRILKTHAHKPNMQMSLCVRVLKSKAFIMPNIYSLDSSSSSRPRILAPSRRPKRRQLEWHLSLGTYSSMKKVIGQEPMS